MNTTNGRAEIYPWQLSQWQQLCDAKQKQRLPHAILISSACGMGKETFARAFAHAMLCHHTNPEGDTCGQCHACHLLRGGSHPDLVFVAAETSGKIIKVDQIRDVVHLINETSMQNGYRVIIIHQAHNMNHNAANSLLKTLEEPPANTLFILLSGQAQRIQATILSRCQKLLLVNPDLANSLQWLKTKLPEQHDFTTETLQIALKMSAGAPITALQMLTPDRMNFREVFYQQLVLLSQGKSDPLQWPAQWHEHDLSITFQLFFYWLHDLLQLIVINDAEKITNLDYADSLVKLAAKIQQSQLLAYMTHVQMVYAKILNSLNLNRQLLLEELLIRWTLISR